MHVRSIIGLWVKGRRLGARELTAFELTLYGICLASTFDTYRFSIIVLASFTCRRPLRATLDSFHGPGVDREKRLS